jgi:chromosome segregation ATPase
LQIKLVETEKTVSDSQLNKYNTQSKLDQTTQDLEEFVKRSNAENEEKNRRINSLHIELKELQDRINDTGAKNLFLNGKVTDIGANYDRTNHEQAGSIDRLKGEYDKLHSDNNDLLNRLNYLTKEVEQSRGNLERNAYDNQQQRNAQDHDLARLNEQINETNVINNNLDGELKMAFRNK